MSIADRLNATVPQRTAAPTAAALALSVVDNAGKLWNQRSNKGEIFLAGRHGQARIKIFQKPMSPDAKPNTPQWFTYIGEDISQAERQAGRVAIDFVWNSFWDNVAADGTEYLSTIFSAPTETDTGVSYQFHPIPDAPVAGPHWVGRWVTLPKLAPAARPNTAPVAQATNGNAVSPSERTTYRAPATQPQQDEDKIPF